MSKPIKAFHYLIVLGLWLFVSASTALATAEVNLDARETAFLQANPVIRVHNELDWPPFNFNDKGKASGFSIDFMNLVAKKTGLQVEYVSGPTWNEFLAMMRAGSLDVMLNIVKTPERKKYLLYTPPYADNPNAILSKKDKPYKSIESLFGKTVALPKGFFTEEVLRKNYPKVKLLPVKNMLESMKAVTFGQADAALGELAVFNYLLSEHLMSDLMISGEAIMGDPEYSLLNIATRQDLPELASILTKGVNAVSVEERKALQRKWLIETRNVAIPLTDQERAYLQDNPLIKVHNEMDWPPYNFSDNGQPLGFSIDFMNLLARKTGLQLEYISGPTWNEFLGMMQDGSLDVMLNIVKTAEREKYLLFTPPYADNPNAIVSKKDSPYKSIESLFGKTVALPKGFFTEEVLRKNYPQIQLLLAKNMLESLKAVSFGQADAALGELAVINYLLSEHLLSDLGVSGEAIMGDPEYSLLNIAARKDLPVLASILSKGVAAVSVEEKKELQNKWLVEGDGSQKILLSQSEKAYLADKQFVRVCVSRNRMPFEHLDDDGEYLGVASDIIQKLSTSLGIPVIRVPNKSWAASKQAFESKQCDVLPLAIATDQSARSMSFSAPFMHEPVVIVTKDDQFFIQGSEELSGLKLGVVKGYALRDLLTQRNPAVDIVEVDTPEQGLRQVQQGELFGYVDVLPAVAYVVQKNGMLDLKVAGKLEFDVDITMATQQGDEVLSRILQKALNTLSNEDIKAISGKWIVFKVEQVFDYKKLAMVIAFFLIIVAIILVKNRSIKKINSQLQQSKHEIENKNRMLEQLAVTDNLTQLFNRHRLDEVLTYEANRACRSASTFGVVMVDVDRFKEVNDAHGHQVGDTVLREVADVLRLHSRRTDTVGRWGGEEFMIVCSDATESGIREFAEQLRVEIESFPFALGEQKTASFGVSVYQSGESVTELIKRADDALYRAKQLGRNRVEWK